MKGIRMSEAMQRMCPLRNGWLCVGDTCMAWRASTEISPRRVLVVPNNADPLNRPAGIPDEWEFVPADYVEGEPAQWVEDARAARMRSPGFCGLAGVPKW